MDVHETSHEQMGSHNVRKNLSKERVKQLRLTLRVTFANSIRVLNYVMGATGRVIPRLKAGDTTSAGTGDTTSLSTGFTA